MAGDWIKMRVWLARDPKVIRMADVLASDREFMEWLTNPVRQRCVNSAYEHVTRNVTVALCVTALLVTWGSAREQGDRVGDDLVLAHCDFETLDAMTDLPGFGAALGSVGWAAEQQDGSILFPKFFKDNESPDDRHKRQNAERQARHRLKMAEESNAKSNAADNVTHNVTVTTEKRREEKSKYTQGFALFWEAYPKKASKGQAERAWQKLSPNEQLTGEILDAVERAKTWEKWQNQGGKFIPYPATWLNARGWEDAPSVTLPKPALQVAV